VIELVLVDNCDWTLGTIGTVIWKGCWLKTLLFDSGWNDDWIDVRCKFSEGF
jgi:hypothetical protein